MSTTTIDYAAFGAELDAIRDRIHAELGEADVRYVVRLDRFSHGMEVIGRLLIHFSFEPLGFGAGVFALWLHKLLQSTEIGHPALHGAWDGLPGAERYDSKTYRWDTPIDEASWRQGHNVRHHQYTNIAGRDGDIHYGGVRLTKETPAATGLVPLWIELPISFLNFGAVMNAHFTGLVDVYFGNGRGGFDFIPDRSWKSIVEAHRRAYRKYLPYYAKNYVLFPLLAGPFFWKVLLGNWLAETLRDLYSAATIWCGHVGEEVQSWPEGTKAHSRGEWYAMQCAASNDFAVPRWVSILCGALDLQIEHHLFPKLPPERLRQIAPEVEAACKRHGVPYRKESWPKTLATAFRHIFSLRREVPAPVAT
jgi:NADPH-dependent stearoyl-CoA 9-desaturase